MSDFAAIGALRDPVLIVALLGPDDVADAASVAVTTLVDLWAASPSASLDLDKHLDYRQIQHWRALDPGGWPALQVWTASPPGCERDVLLVHGMAPDVGWRGVCEWLVELFDHADAQLMVLLGARSAGVPYDAPLPVETTSYDATLASAPMSAPGSSGFLLSLVRACATEHIPAIALRVSVPDYVDASICPKASWSLVGAIEEVLGTPIPAHELHEAALAWQRGVERLASEDSAAGRAVAAMGVGGQAWQVPEATGEAIAAEFERFLRRRGDA